MVKIKKIVLKDGSVRWRVCGVSVGMDPLTGRRAQRTITCRAKRELEAELHRLGHSVARGTYVKPWNGLVPELIDSYLSNGDDQWEANTRPRWTATTSRWMNWAGAQPGALQRRFRPPVRHGRAAEVPRA